jgi:hypothetical protein
MTGRVNRQLDQQVLRWAYRRDDDPVSPVSHVVMFWILITGAASLFAASVLIPVWREHQDIVAARTRAEQRLIAMRQDLARKQAIVKALQEDPVVNEHTALREMNYHILGQEIIPTQPESVVLTAAQPTETPEDAHRFNWLTFVPSDYLRLNTWIEKTREPDFRRGMLITAAFLSAVALVAFAPPAPGGKVARLLRRQG